MQHHDNRRTDTGSQPGVTGFLVSDRVTTSDEIEYYVREGKRLQGEAVAGALRGGLRRLGRLSRA